jgi:hypothetical protein
VGRAAARLRNGAAMARRRAEGTASQVKYLTALRLCPVY